MQRNWIGRSEGAEFEMIVCDSEGQLDEQGRGVAVFTTRPDTSFGMTYAVLAPEHPLVAQLTTAQQAEAVTAFVAQARKASETDRLKVEGNLEKRGVFTGAYLFNSFNRKPVPLYIADYVLMGYGTGAIMAVPGQDQRDWDFAVSHGLPILRTVQPPTDWEGEQAYTGDGPAINNDLQAGKAVCRCAWPVTFIKLQCFVDQADFTGLAIHDTHVGSD